MADRFAVTDPYQWNNEAFHALVASMRMRALMQNAVYLLSLDMATYW